MDKLYKQKENFSDKIYDIKANMGGTKNIHNPEECSKKIEDFKTVLK